MLKLITGAVNSTKSEKMTEEVREALKNGEDIILIVPDQ